jgi:hypothetical protein
VRAEPDALAVATRLARRHGWQWHDGHAEACRDGNADGRCGVAPSHQHPQAATNRNRDRVLALVPSFLLLLFLGSCSEPGQTRALYPSSVSDLAVAGLA